MIRSVDSRTGSWLVAERVPGQDKERTLATDAEHRVVVIEQLA